MKTRNLNSFYSMVMLSMFIFMLMAGLLFDLNIYHLLDNDKNSSDDSHLPYAYILTRLRNSSNVAVENNRIYLEDEGIRTCIYFYDEYLWEITYYDGFLFSEKDGEKICRIDDFTVMNKNGQIQVDYSVNGIKKKLIKEVSDE